MSDPFDAVIADATKREAAEAKRREQEKAVRDQHAAERKQRAEVLAQQYARQRRLDGFKEGFLHAVAKRVAHAKMSPDYIRQLQEFSEALVNRDESKLPKIDPRQYEKILDIFAYGLKLAKERDEAVPANTFYGQRLVKEKQDAAPAKPAPIVYTSAPLKHRTMSTNAPSPTNVVKLKPAFTARTKRAGRKAS